MKLNKYDQAKICLAFYASKYDWVKKEMKKNDIDLNIKVDDMNLKERLQKECNQLKIKDYIWCIKEEKQKRHINELYKVFKTTKNIDKKIEVTQKIIEAKEKMRLKYGNSN